MGKIIDLRSDTVTHPTQEMREAIYNAEIGDDILGEDPTVKRLEKMVADMLGKEAGLFVTSGTMGNQLAIMTLANRGEEVLVADNSHIFNLEVGGLAALSQVQTRSFPMKQGKYDIDLLENLIQERGIQRAITSVLCIENTNDLNKGLVVPKINIDEVCTMAKKHNIKIYMDGARLLNAEAALDIPAKDIVENVDAVMIALTKGLAAPFGGVLVGNNKFIEKARWYKQRIGGGFRQAGFMAAPGILALETMKPQLLIDHKNATLLGNLLKDIENLCVNTENIQTNIVTGTLDGTVMLIDEFIEILLDRDIKVKKISSNSFRMVTHYGIVHEDIIHVANQINEVLTINK